MSSFVHLHNHTEYSMLDGASKTKALFTEVERLGQPAVAMSDHGNAFGAYDFWSTSKNFSVKPIIGIEAYVAPSSRLSRQQEFWATGGAHESDAAVEGGKDVSGGGRYTHMTMWATTPAGLRNIFRLSSLASYEGFYMKPRMDRELIAQYAEGIVATTGCPSGEVQTRLRLGQYDEALRAAATYQEIFGRENYFLEVMDHGIDIERSVRNDLLRLGKELGLPPLATNDSHYVTEDQADAHDNLLCVGVGRNKDDQKRFRFNGSGYYIKAADDMRRLFDFLPGACDNTLLVSEMVESYDPVFAPVDRMPKFDVPPGETQESWLRKEIERGIRLRFPGQEPPGLRERIETEMAVIGPMGFSPYFLIVADICQFARANDIPLGPGRGSAAGSMVSYLLHIIDIDPMEHGLFFERFLNPERVSPPDIDLDFDDRQRDRVIAYVTRKYGAAFTSMVNTFGTLKAKAAVKDSTRILGLDFALGDKITKALPPDVMGKSIALADTFNPDAKRYDEAGEFRSLYENDPDVRRVVDTSMGLEGLTRGTGVHASAFIISSEPLLDVIPMHRRDKGGVIITGFSYPQCEAMGLMKMDFLGLRNLGIMDQAVKNIKAVHGIDLDLRAIPMDDRPTYELLQRGDTLGVFQLDGGAMRSLLRLLRPTRFDDIAAVLALYRPGPMGANAHINYAERKNGRQAIEPIHPELREALDPILGDTFHLIVYQEQIMAAARALAGYTLGGADLLRRAMGKKKKEVLDKEWEHFSGGMHERGFSPEATQALWDVMVPFADYAFNKSHAAAYGMISYWTAYLKANYPKEYMAALLDSVGSDKDKLALYLHECRRAGLLILPPEVNEAMEVFTPTREAIRFGLGAIRNVGTAAVSGIVAAREADGPFTSFEDFVRRCPSSLCNKKAVESLIKAGAFDSLGHPRQGLIVIYEDVMDARAYDRKSEEIGLGSLFDEPLPDRKVPDMEWDQSLRLEFERQMLGLYVSAHPLNGLEGLLERYSDTQVTDLLEDEYTRPEGDPVAMTGLISAMEIKRSKKGDYWAILTLEDLTGSVECLVFPKTYAKVHETIAANHVAWVSGKVSRRDGTPSVFVDDVRLLDPESEQTDTERFLT